MLFWQDYEFDKTGTGTGGMSHFYCHEEWKRHEHFPKRLGRENDLFPQEDEQKQE